MPGNRVKRKGKDERSLGDRRWQYNRAERSRWKERKEEAYCYSWGRCGDEQEWTDGMKYTVRIEIVKS